MFKDLRHGVRLLLRAKGWTAVVVLSLALGIGANTALFSAINGLLLKKLSVIDPDTLVRLRMAGRNQMATSRSGYGPGGRDAAGLEIGSTFSYPMYQLAMTVMLVVSAIAGYLPARRALRVDPMVALHYE